MPSWPGVSVSTNRGLTVWLITKYPSATSQSVKLPESGIPGWRVLGCTRPTRAWSVMISWQVQTQFEPNRQGLLTAPKGWRKRGHLVRDDTKCMIRLAWLRQILCIIIPSCNHYHACMCHTYQLSERTSGILASRPSTSRVKMAIWHHGQYGHTTRCMRLWNKKNRCSLLEDLILCLWSFDQDVIKMSSRQHLRMFNGKQNRQVSSVEIGPFSMRDICNQE